MVNPLQMSKACQKCGHVRTESDSGPETECPRCGAIYAKVEMALAAKATESSNPKPTPKPKVRIADHRLFVLCIVAMCLIVYSVYAYHQRKIAVAVKAREQSEQRALREAADRLAERQKREAAAEARAASEAERRAARTPSQVREEKLREQFSIWDGSHNATEAAIKARMHNPDSYKHVKTVYSDSGYGKGLTIQTTFRGTNAFGGVVTNLAVAKVDDEGHVTTLEISTRR